MTIDKIKQRALAFKGPWRAMLIVNIVILVVLLVDNLVSDTPEMEYLHLLVDYNFGFVKRGFVGEVVSFFLPVVPMWFVYVLGGAMWLAALTLFLKLFDREFGFSAATAPLFIFIFGSPAFFKNFMLTIGYFDIYGCIWALAMLLMPARSFAYVVIAALGCAILLLVHHVQMLMYVPTIATIVVARYYFPRGLNAGNLLGGALLLLGIGALFWQISFNSAMPATMDELAAYLNSRASNPADIHLPTVDIWYRPLASDIALTRMEMGSNLLRLPIYIGLVLLHLPLISYFKRLLAALDHAWQRQLMTLAIIGVTLGYFIIASIIHDYARWFSSWSVCMFLLADRCEATTS